jgi:Protein of unknown function (DUF1706)
MSEYTVKEAFLATLTRSRAEWESLLARVPIDSTELPGAAGAWSVKDIVAHIAAYERWTAIQIEAMLRGVTTVTPDPSIPPEADAMTTDERNELLYQLLRDLPLEDVLIEERATYRRILADLQALSEEAYARVDCEWTDGNPLGESIVGNTFGHYQDHIPGIEAFILGQQQNV